MAKHTESKRHCPICGKTTVQKFRPFCSRRCADIDLGRWFNGDYRLATEEAPEAGEMPPEDRDEEPR